MKSADEIIKGAIYWQRHSTNQRYFYAQNDGELLLLRLNDFPDEPLFTLIRGIEIVDLDYSDKLAENGFKTSSFNFLNLIIDLFLISILALVIERAIAVIIKKV